MSTNEKDKKIIVWYVHIHDPDKYISEDTYNALTVYKSEYKLANKADLERLGLPNEEILYSADQRVITAPPQLDQWSKVEIADWYRSTDLVAFKQLRVISMYTTKELITEVRENITAYNKLRNAPSNMTWEQLGLPGNFDRMYIKDIANLLEEFSDYIDVKALMYKPSANGVGYTSNYLSQNLIVTQVRNEFMEFYEHFGMSIKEAKDSDKSPAECVRE